MHLPPASSAPLLSRRLGKYPRHLRVTGPPPATVQEDLPPRRYGAGNTDPDTTTAAGRSARPGARPIRYTCPRPGNGARRGRLAQEKMIPLAPRQDVQVPNEAGRTVHHTWMVTSSEQCRIPLVRSNRLRGGLGPGSPTRSSGLPSISPPETSAPHLSGTSGRTGQSHLAGIGSAVWPDWHHRQV